VDTIEIKRFLAGHDFKHEAHADRTNAGVTTIIKFVPLCSTVEFELINPQAHAAAQDAQEADSIEVNIRSTSEITIKRRLESQVHSCTEIPAVDKINMGVYTMHGHCVHTLSRL
jgi:hypothetical protein